MKKIIVGLMATLLFLGCSSTGVEEQAVEPKLVVGKSLSGMELNDQFEKAQVLDASTKKVIFAFSKDMAHICNDYFVTQSPTYLSEYNTQFVADVSVAPSLIRSMFILPGLKDFKHTVLLLDDEKVAAPYRTGMNVEKIVVAYIDDKSITKIITISSENELKKVIEAK
ncbi:MAG: hypothetical protein PF437_06410 [Sulfurimonas sp.]|jgi:hypothetical protein|nr:hypothetical protein [Sulfurimonas sp.]